MRTPNYVYDLSQNRSFNYFEIYSVNDLLLKTEESSSKIQIEDFLPAHIRIDTFPDKGWGLVTKIACRKNDVIYRALVRRFPNEIEVFSKEHGVKKIDKDVHLGDLDKKYNLFSYYNCFLNHSDNPSAYHDTDLMIENGNIYVVLRASKNIEPGEELTINYFYINEYVYYARSYMNFILKQFQRDTAHHPPRLP
jgi:hypothetical protein